MKKKYRWVVWLLILSGVSYMFLMQKNKKIRIETYAVEPSTMQHTIEETGSVVSANKLTLSSEVGGNVTHAVSENSFVKKGDLLLSVDDSDLDHQIAQLNANLQSIEGQKKMSIPTLYRSQISAKQLEIEGITLSIQELQKQYDDAKLLYDNGAISSDELEKLKLSLEQLTLKKEAQQKEIDFLYEQSKPKEGSDVMYDGQSKAVKENINRLKNQKKKTDLFSPMDGVISQISVKKGEFLPPATPVITISDSNHLQIEAYLLTEDIIYLHEGDKVQIIQETNGEDLQGSGKILKISPFAVEKISGLGLNEKKVKVTVLIEEEGDLNLFENGDVKLNFILKEMHEVLSVPKSSVFSLKEGTDAVFLVKKGKAYLQEIKIGYESNDVFVISNGLSTGDEVIRDPNIEGLKEGSLVQSMQQ